MAEARLGSIWPDQREPIVHGQDHTNRPGRARPGYVLPETAGAGGGVRAEGLRFEEFAPGELVVAETFPTDLFLVEFAPGELEVDDTVSAGLKIRATDSGIFVSD